jgi:nitrate/nitrite transporter NarK
VGAAGGVGGFLVPLWLGVLKDMTGTYRAGFWVFAVVTALAWVTTISIRRGHPSTPEELPSSLTFNREKI